MGKEESGKENRVIGILAHVDAGKTTLSEALLYRTHRIRKLGRVDKGDSFLDTDAMERARGITIYAKQTHFVTPERGIGFTLLDTPGHADFSPEMERTLRVLDLAILVISASDGINAQVKTLWELLKHYHVPVIIFVNKMDQAENLGGEEALKDQLITQLHQKLSDGIMELNKWQSPEMQENLALLDEDLLNRLMAGESIGEEDLAFLTGKGLLFPLCFGAALKMQGIDELLRLLDICSPTPSFPPEFGARVFKITRDVNGERLTHLRITGGVLKTRQSLAFEKEDGRVLEKVTQIRRYSGERYQQIDEAEAGEICSVTGLTETFAGQGLGYEESAGEGLMHPVLTWQVRLRMGEDPFAAYQKLRILSEEEPMLAVAYDEKLRKITIRMMGQMQREIVADLAMKRFGLEIAFEQPSVIYKETIALPSVGIGHFEPLRHYAEVHLLLEPGETGSGLTFESRCPTDVLAGNWQRLILSSLGRRKLTGVLTGSELTDIKISLIAGRAHEKHTEGGDFPQAARRAVRQALMHAANVLLEPWYDFRLELPGECLGRALADLTDKQAEMKTPVFEDERAVVAGSVAVSRLADYADELASYTRGEGRLTLKAGSYRPCPDPGPVIESLGYEAEADQKNPSSSVFCSHGAGTVVPWYEVAAMAHVDNGLGLGKMWEADRNSDGRPLYVTGLKTDDKGRFSGESLTEWCGNEEKTTGNPFSSQKELKSRVTVSRAGASGREMSYGERQKKLAAHEDELKAIFERTYGPVKEKLPREEREKKVIYAGSREASVKGKKEPVPEREILLVDGYNIIFAWENLRELTEKDVKAARDRLMDILSNYAGYTQKTVILVFDAYRVSGGREQVLSYHNITVIFTKEAETADQYIEKASHELIRKNNRVSVATSDGVEQLIIFGAGARRISAGEMLEDIIRAEQEIREDYLEKKAGGKYFLQNNLSDKLAKLKIKKEKTDGKGY